MIVASHKPRAKKKRLIAAAKRATAAPFFAILKVFGKRKVQRWRLNPGQRRRWRRNRIKP